MIDLKDRQLVLASGSPRRHQLLKELDVDFSIEPKHVEEVYADTLVREEIPEYLSELKANAFSVDELTRRVILTADTIVWLGDHELQKPEDNADASRMLRLLSGRSHEVYTAFTVRTAEGMKTVSDRTVVTFRPLLEAEIDHYVRQYHPLDKAGAYGIQEWIGYIGVERIEGCYFNVMGLPLRLVYHELTKC